MIVPKSDFKMTLYFIKNCAKIISMSEIQDVEHKINKIVEDFFFQGIIEPPYKRIEHEEDEYDCFNTINRFYDENNVLRKETTTDKNGYILNIVLYDENEKIIFKGNKTISDDIKNYEIEKEDKESYKHLVISISTGEIIEN